MIDAGMNVAEVEELGVSLRSAADQLKTYTDQLEKLVARSTWAGPVGVRFKQQAWPRHRTLLRTVESDLRGFSRSAFNNVAEQRRASDATPGAPRVPPTAFPHGLDNQHPQDQAERRPVSVSQIIDRQQHLGRDQFEIMRVSDHPPRYIVNLPGIEFGTHALWGTDHLRDLQTASAARFGGPDADAYAQRVQLEMQRAGVPPGAEVLLVGHSQGAIASMNLARDASFNRPGNTSPDGPYHVQITHVVAAGAGVREWVDDPPQGTNVLLAINRNDVVAEAIQRGRIADVVNLKGTLEQTAGHFAIQAPTAIVNDVFDIVDARSRIVGDPGRVVMEFSTNVGADGHGYDNYERGLEHADPAAQRWLDGAASRYFTGGGQMQSVQIDLPDQIQYGRNQL